MSIECDSDKRLLAALRTHEENVPVGEASVKMRSYFGRSSQHSSDFDYGLMLIYQNSLGIFLPKD